MKLTAILVSIVASKLVAGHGNNDPNPDLKNLVKEDSLVDLVHQTAESLAKSANWEMDGDCKFEEGRFILTPKPLVTSSDDESSKVVGSLWNKNLVSFSTSNGFTFETTMRSVGAMGQTGAALNYYLLRDSDKYPFDSAGPGMFDGLQISLQEDTVKSFLSDGSKHISMLKPFSTCYLAFQNSDVPLTLRLSYSDKTSFKLSLNNYLCFETEDIKFDDLKKLKLGISASSPNDLTKFEQFELLKFETYNKVTDEALLKDKGNLASQPQVVTKVMTTEASRPTSHRALFQEKEQKLREALLNKNTDKVDTLFKQAELGNEEILSKLDTLQLLLANAKSDGSSAQPVVDNDFIIQTSKNHGELKALISQNNELINEISLKNAENIKLMSDIVVRLSEKMELMEDQISRGHKLIEIVSSKIGSVSNDRHFNSIIAKLNEVDQNQRSTIEQAKKDGSLVSLQTRIKWLIISIFLFFIALAYVVYKLRSEVKHGKIL